MAPDRAKRGDDPRIDRRGYLKLAAATGGAGLLAGCTGGGGATPTNTPSGDGGDGGDGGGGGTTVGQTNQEPVVLGLQAPFTGMPKSALQERNGAKVAADQTGTILGRPIELKYRDTALKPSRGARNARELINEGADFLAGGISSAVEKAIAEVAGKNQVLYMGSDAGSSALTGKFLKSYYPYYFRPHPSAWILSTSLAQYAADELGMTGDVKVGVIAPNYTWGKSTWSAFEAKMNEVANPNVVVELFPSLGTRQHGPSISRLKSANPDIVFTSLWGADLVTFMQQASQAGLIEQTRIASISYGMAVANQLKQDSVEGILSASGGYFYSIENETNNFFVDEYLNRYGKMPPARAAGNYTAVRLLAMGAEQAGTVSDTQAIIDTFEQNTFPMVYGELGFRMLDHQSPTNIPVGIMVKGEDPKWVKMKNQKTVSGDKLIRSMDTMKDILCNPSPDNQALQQACEEAPQGEGGD